MHQPKASITLANQAALGRLASSNVTPPPSRNRHTTASRVAPLTGGTGHRHETTGRWDQ
jgi:hypothetical protein